MITRLRDLPTPAFADKYIIQIDNDEIFIYDEEKEETIFKMPPNDALIEALELLGYQSKYV
jgi:hypothetical protein